MFVANVIKNIIPFKINKFYKGELPKTSFTVARSLKETAQCKTELFDDPPSHELISIPADNSCSIRKILKNNNRSKK